MSRIRLESQSDASSQIGEAEGIAAIQSVLSQLVKGDLEKRFTHLDAYGSYSGICSDINDLMDKVETFFREAIGRMQDFAAGESDCQIDERGFENTFLETIRLFNRNLQKSEQQRERQRVVRNTLHETVQTLNETVAHMAETAKELDENSRNTLDSADTVDASSSEATGLAEEAANSCRELATAINEIAKSMQQANTVTVEAVALADTTSTTIADLLQSSNQISKIIKLIEGIAHQTNLLALNASIEAARAGDAGRGFAVVASEVKNLAFESRENAKTISSQIEAICAQASDSSKAVAEINAVIKEINNISQSVAAATEEQGTATASISGIMEDVSRAAENIASSISSVANSARQNTATAHDVGERVTKLSELSANLTKLSIELEP